MALAPSLYDPVEQGVELGYGEAETQRGVELRNRLGFERAVDLVESAAELLQNEGLRTGVVGFCWGGSVAFLANTRLGLPAVSYYGGRTVPLLGERPKAPLMLHFGENDPIIPPEDVQKHRDALPGAEIHVWPGADHGFNCEQRADYNAEVAQQALTRTLGFLQKNLR